MSRYYGNISGNRGEATRQGTASSGFRASARSYIGSVTVWLQSDEEKGDEEADLLTIEIARGSRVGGIEVFSQDLASAVEFAEAGYHLTWTKEQ